VQKKARAGGQCWERVQDVFQHDLPRRRLPGGSVGEPPRTVWLREDLVCQESDVQS
jgi:hypothetical protein